MKTFVRVKKDSSLGAVKGETGFIDGYIRGADDCPYAVVIIGSRIVFLSIRSLEVINV